MQRGSVTSSWNINDRIGNCCRNCLVHSLAQTGSFSEGVVFANEGVRIAKEVNHPYSLAYMTCGLGFLFLLKGDLKLAIELFQQCEKLCQDANIRVLNPQITAYLGLARALSGHNDEALPLLELADDQTMSIGRFSGPCASSRLAVGILSNVRTPFRCAGTRQKGPGPGRSAQRAGARSMVT